jgi:hypothetical protein
MATTQAQLGDVCTFTIVPEGVRISLEVTLPLPEESDCPAGSSLADQEPV